ncbi:hypothetical protein WN943_011058 [Citrus x changshan-huyou]
MASSAMSLQFLLILAIFHLSAKGNQQHHLKNHQHVLLIGPIAGTAGKRYWTFSQFGIIRGIMEALLRFKIPSTGKKFELVGEVSAEGDT